jgi:uncharacterized repeat protein (TIGR03803 family)
MALAIIALTLIGSTPVWASTVRVLYYFHSYPNGGGGANGELVFDSQGNLYGTNWEDGCGGGGGDVFELMPSAVNNWSAKLLYCFGSGQAGNTPLAGVVFDSRGNLYTTTPFGGGSGGGGQGAVVELMPNPDGTWTEVTLHVFSGGSDGANPSARLVLDDADNLYSTTPNGGFYGKGVVFRVSTASVPVLTVLYAFTGGADGSGPSGSVIFDASGNLYGVTSSGGDYGKGTVFKLAPNEHSLEWTETVLYSFNGEADGSLPDGGLVFDGAGNLYGVANLGGIPTGRPPCDEPGCGTVFKLTPNPDGSWSETTLYYFRMQGGFSDFAPVGPLVLDTAGNLYGVTSPEPSSGTVFKLTPSAEGQWTKAILLDIQDYGFCDLGIMGPGLLLDSAGNVYGGCGGDHHGAVFEITP